jgi:hypothetical protein
MSQNPATSVQGGPQAPVQQPRNKAAHPLVRALGVATLLVLLCILCTLGTTLWQEWRMLRREVDRAELTRVVGYPEIAPALTFAQRPPNWFHREGNEALLWSRWIDGVGHHWYRFTPGDIDGTHVVMPNLRNRARAIDFPVIEIDDGRFWRNIPAAAQVVGLSLGGQTCAYPVPVLLGVQVINDLINGHPYLVTLNPMAPATEAVAIFDAQRDGHRLTMASTGYFLDRKPLLYDRRTESLWRDDGDALKSIAGQFKGEKLFCLAKPVPTTWASWLSLHPRGRLVVGADRTHGIPRE